LTVHHERSVDEVSTGFPKCRGRLIQNSDREQRISAITLGFSDLERTLRFYEALGWTGTQQPTTRFASSKRVEPGENPVSG
jgi:hypothetical protein